MKKIIISCLLAIPALLAAQEQKTDSIHQLGELVVSATRNQRPTAVSKIEAPLAKIPITVSSLTTEELQLKGYYDASEALREVPGVYSYRQYGAFHMFFIRGFYESLLVNDGMRDDRHTLWQSAPITGLASIERIEVLKGAASMQQGHSAIGGVVNLVRKQPQAQLGAYALLSYGSYNTLRLQAGATGAATSRLLVRADVEAIRSKGWRDNYTKGFNASLMAKYLISSKSDLQLSLYGNSDRYGGDYGIPHYPFDAYRRADNTLYAHKGERNPEVSREAVYGFPEDELGHKNLSGQIKYEYRFSRDWRLSERFFLSSDEIRYMSTDYYGWVTSPTPEDSLPYYIIDEGAKRYTDLNTLERGGFAFDYNTLSLQNQLELTGKLKQGSLVHNLLFGYNYLSMGMKRYDRAELSGEGYSRPITLLNPVRNQGALGWHFTREQKFIDQTHGLYVQDYISWGKLALLAGLRLDYFQRDFTVSDTDGKQVKQSHGTQKLRNLALTYRAGLVYSPIEAVNLYLSASNFYKPQKISLSSEVAYLDKSGKEMGAEELSKLPPMRGHQFELGTHILYGKTLSLDAAFYYLRLKNKLNSYLGTLANGKRRGALVDGYESKGFEISADYRPLDQLGLQLAYAYTDARVKADKGANSQYASNDGHWVEHSPKHRLNAWLMSAYALTKESRLRGGLGLEVASSFYTSESNLYQVSGYGILNALLAYEYKNWRLQLNLGNLLDKDYTRHVLYDFQYLPAEGRNFTASLSFRL